MQLTIRRVDCFEHHSRTKREDPFHCAVIQLNAATDAYDAHLVKSLRERGEHLAQLVNPGAANDSSQRRSMSRITTNAVAGVVAEWAWKTFLNTTYIELLVRETDMEDKAAQIDLETIQGGKSIEVRSSFPRNGVPFALCDPVHQFDVIGPYSNKYKPGEVGKDFYVRALFPFASRDFKARLAADGFEVWLTGGATRAMFADEQLRIRKSFIPEDEVSVERLKTETEYYVIPFARALDSIEVYRGMVGSRAVRG